MELYKHREPDARLGRIVQTYGGLLLVAAAVAGVVGAAWLVRPWVLAVWRAFAVPLLDTARRAIGV